MRAVWENQRHYGVAGWLGPAPFERKQWTDAEGQPACLTSDELPLHDPKWKPVTTELTDGEGWVYGTSFAHVSFPREGGRACKRATDRVRQRQWLRTEGDRGITVHGICRPNAHPVDVQRGLQQFMAFLSEIGLRRNLWEFLPWDPIAWLLVHAEHQEYLRQEDSSAAVGLSCGSSSFESLQLRLNECMTHKSDDSMEEMLARLARGARISQAAYGYAMEAGHLDTIENFVAMHTIHAQYFDPVAGASVEANLEAVRRFTGFNKEDIIMSDWSNREFQPCHFLALDSSQQCIVLAIRGSMEMGDFVTDISGAPLTVDIGGVSGKVHEGSMASAIYVQSKTAPFLQEVFERYPGWSLFITGHSLGGGVAALLSLILKFENILPSTAGPVHCVAVGSAAVMSENLAELCKEFVTTLVFRYDVVPRLSAYSIESMMVELVNASPAKKTVDSIVRTASSAMQSIKQKFTEFKRATEKEKPKERVADLRLTRELAADDEVVARALRAVQETLRRGNQSSYLQNEAPASTPIAEPTGWQPVKTFSPLYPPGRVLWLLGSKRACPNDNKKEQWWEQLHNWSREKITALHRSTSFSSNKRKPTGITEKVASDMSWLNDWMEENNSSQDLDDTQEEKKPEESTPLPDGVLIEAERKTFSRLLIHPFMMQDHLPRSYHESIRELQTQFHNRRTID